jgi:hypothetical protein
MTDTPEMASAYTQPDRTLDELIHQKARIVRTKLEVLALATSERLAIWQRNLQRIDDDEHKVSYMLQRLSRSANYLMRAHRDKEVFYKTAFDLAKERREQDVECWRDIVLVMRDLLVAWEAHEQAKAKAIFLQG